MIFRDNNKLILQTKRSPKGFKGVVYICLEGINPNSVNETIYSVEQLKKFKTVDENELDAEWRSAFRLKAKPPPTIDDGGGNDDDDDDVSEGAWKQDYYDSIKGLWGDPFMGLILLPIIILPILCLSLLACVNLVNDYFTKGTNDS